MLLIALLILPLAAGLICLAVPSQRALENLNLLTLAGVAALAAGVAFQVLDQQSIEALGGFFYADALSALVIGLTAFVSLVCGIYAIGYFRREKSSGKITAAQVRRYYSLTPLFVFAMLLVTVAYNLGVMWVAIEGTTLASVLLIAFYNEKTSLEAAWKYIIIGSVGIALALFGTIVTFSAAQTVGDKSASSLNWSLLVTRAENFNAHAMKLGFILALLGYGTKAGLAPMHTWKPDAYAEAPVPASALLGAGVLNCALYGILRFDVLATKCLGPAFPTHLLLFFGLASMLVAAPFVLVQRNFRRLHAYSSIEHAGIIVTAVGFGGRLGMLGAMLHMLFHAVTKPLLFFCAGNVQQHLQTPYLRKVRGAIHYMPITGALLFFVMLAVTGVPPFSIFQSEFTILSAGFYGHHTWLAALFVFCVVTIFCGFLQHVSQMILGSPSEGIARAVPCPWKTGVMLFLAALILGLGFKLPHSVFLLVQQAAQIIGGGV